jgi:glycosyltransferase involved in cell wall biosynthesis
MLKISIIIACYKSERKILPTIASIEKQIGIDFDSELEILMIHGDRLNEFPRYESFLKIRHIANPNQDAISAKYIGSLSAQGKYICFLDHDELLLSPYSLRQKLDIFEQNTNVKIIFTSGYQMESRASLNFYASVYGDPINFYLYQTPNLIGLREAAADKCYEYSKKSNLAAVYKLHDVKRPVLLEALATGCVIDRAVLSIGVMEPEMVKNILPHLFYLLDPSSDEFAIMKKDPIGHNSVSTFGEVLRKNRWRISNAVLNTSNLMEAGIVGRNKLLPANVRSLLKLRRILLAIRILTVLPVVVDSLSIAIKHRRIGLIFHGVLLYLDVIYILQSIGRKVFKLKNKTFTYSEYDS